MNTKTLFRVIIVMISIALFYSCEKKEEVPIASFSIEGEYEVNATITFISTSENAVEYKWSFGDGETATGAVVTHEFEEGKKYTVVLTVKSGDGIEVNSEPQIIEIEDNRIKGLLQVPESVLDQVPAVSLGTLGAYSGEIPSSFFLNMPPAGNQGAEGSCVAWAVAYGAMSYIYFHEEGYGKSGSLDYSKVFSPEFLYNQIKTSSDCRNAGSYYVDYNGKQGALSFIEDKGCCTWAKMPYIAGDCSQMPESEQISNALQYKVRGFKRIKKSDFTQINMKKLLLQNNPIIASMNVHPNFRKLKPKQSGAYIYDSKGGESEGGHAVVVYGYDDNIRAYKILNSWGGNWANSGSFWIPYDFFSSVIKVAYIIETLKTDENKSINLSGVLNFGDVTVNTSKTKTFTISNTGSSSISVSSINYPDGFSGDWTHGIINAGQSKSVTVTFSPTVVKNYEGTIVVNSDATGGNNMASVSGKGSKQETKSISVTNSLDFGSISVNSSKTKTLTITNTGNQPIYVELVSYPDNGFSGDWTKGSINAGQSKSVTVTFKPTAARSYNGKITIHSDATSGTNVTSVSGTGVQEETKLINVSGDLNFGEVNVRSFSGKCVKYFTISNIGNAPISISSIDYPNGFKGNWDNGSIAAGQSEIVKVTFYAAECKTYSGNIIVNSDANGTNKIYASGSGIEKETKSINVSGNLNFGEINVGSTSTKSFTVSNTGSTTISISSINYSEGFSGNWNGGNISAGQSKSVTVTFSPTAAKSYSGTITVNSDATSGNTKISVSGTGGKQETKSINVSGNLNFGEINVGSTSTKSFTVSNTGSTTISISSINYPDGFSGNWNGGNISAGQSKSVTVTFSPTVSKNYNGNITVNSDADGTNKLYVSGSGKNSNPVPTGTGKVTFYTRIQGEGWIDVTLKGETFGLTYFYPSGNQPPCGETVKAKTRTLNVGTYNYTAKTHSTGRNMSGTFQITNNGCTLVEVK